MIRLQKEIKACFKARYTPNAEQLVEMDGFDVLEKEGAVKFFSGKSWKDVLGHLQSRKTNIVAGADYQLEEWSVLKPSARYYYLRSYLEFLLETQSENNPDEQYVSDFFHQLYQTVYMYRLEAYGNEQKALLRKIAEYTFETIKNHKGVEDWSDDIAENINIFLSELKNHG